MSATARSTNTPDASYRAIHDIEKEECYYPDAREIDPASMPDFDLLWRRIPLSGIFSRWPEKKGLTMQEVLSSLKLPDWLKSNDLRIFYSKMSPDCFRMTAAGRLQSSSPHFMTWGIMSNGLCLTANISESHNPGEGCSLSAILIPMRRKNTSCLRK